jgi:hypothetical protein
MNTPLSLAAGQPGQRRTQPGQNPDGHGHPLIGGCPSVRPPSSGGAAEQLPSVTTAKTCRTCKRSRPLAEFGKHGRAQRTGAGSTASNASRPAAELSAIALPAISPS